MGVFDSVFIFACTAIFSPCQPQKFHSAIESMNEEDTPGFLALYIGHRLIVAATNSIEMIRDKQMLDEQSVSMGDETPSNDN